MMDVKVLLGPAGTGKSTLIREQIQTHGHRLLLTATTGVAAYNLSEHATTINSLMGYFDHASLARRMDESWWPSYRYEALKDWDGVVIEEVSMMRGDVLDLLTSTFLKINQWRENEGIAPLKLLLVGDYLQLPPICRDRLEPIYPFQAGWYPSIYQPYEIKLSTIHRQRDPRFQQLLHLARIGDGVGTTQMLKANDVRFVKEPFYKWQGFSLYPTNNSVDLHNRTRLSELETEGYSLVAERWGTQTDDLKEIPDVCAVKKGCRVRLTANGRDLIYANGRLGTLLECKPDEYCLIQQDTAEGRDEEEPVRVGYHYRLGMRPAHMGEDSEIVNRTWHMRASEFDDYLHTVLLPEKILPFYDPRERMICIGVCKYFPVQLGYASTYHRAQGLSLSNVQIDTRNRMAGSFQMIYVALSRCRTLDGLLIVGEPGQLQRRINTAPQVRQYV